MADIRARLARARRCLRNNVEYVSIFDVLAIVSRAKNKRKLWRDIRLKHEELLDGVHTRLIFDEDDAAGVATPAIMASHISVLLALVPGADAADARAALVLANAATP
jgi:hypothetical protein